MIVVKRFRDFPQHLQFGMPNYGSYDCCSRYASICLNDQVATFTNDYFDYDQETRNQYALAYRWLMQDESACTECLRYIVHLFSYDKDIERDILESDVTGILGIV